MIFTQKRGSFKTSDPSAQHLLQLGVISRGVVLAAYHSVRRRMTTRSIEQGLVAEVADVWEQVSIDALRLFREPPLLPVLLKQRRAAVSRYFRSRPAQLGEESGRF